MQKPYVSVKPKLIAIKFHKNLCNFMERSRIFLKNIHFEDTLRDGQPIMHLQHFTLAFAYHVIVRKYLHKITEFTKFVHKEASWQRSSFLSSFFTLVGTHGFHITVGLLWMIVAMCRIAFRPLIHASVSQVMRMAYFWHFLDFVWIFIFTVVYGMGLLL